MFLNIARLCWAFNIKEDPKTPVDISESGAESLMQPRGLLILGL